MTTVQQEHRAAAKRFEHNLNLRRMLYANSKLPEVPNINAGQTARFLRLLGKHELAESIRRGAKHAVAETTAQRLAADDQPEPDNEWWPAGVCGPHPKYAHLHYARMVDGYMILTCDFNPRRAAKLVAADFGIAPEKESEAVPLLDSAGAKILRAWHSGMGWKVTNALIADDAYPGARLLFDSHPDIRELTFLGTRKAAADTDLVRPITHNEWHSLRAKLAEATRPNSTFDEEVQVLRTAISEIRPETPRS
jgi:hypothetical protein